MAAAINIAAAASSEAHCAMRTRQLDASAAMKKHMEVADQHIREQLKSADERIALLTALTDECQQHPARGTDKRFTKRLEGEIRSGAKALGAFASIAGRARVFLETRQQDGPVDEDSSRREALEEVSRLMRLHLAQREEDELPAVSDQKAHESSDAIESVGLIAVLEQLGRLHDIGVLTQEEFDAKKAEILRRL